MPIYEFSCLECQLLYEELAKYEEEGVYLSVVCPSCGSDKKKKQPSKCSFAFSNPVGTDRYANNHDYRYKHKAPGVAAERVNAIANSHMGPEPYNKIDDISSGKHFGDLD